MHSYSPLQTKPYPGRFIIIGKNKEHAISVYGVTARSSASRAKRYVFDEIKNTIAVQATDEAVMAEGNLDLLDYTAVRFYKNGILVGNGRQTDLFHTLNSSTASEELKTTLISETYEPDKYLTPRITGCILFDGASSSVALSIIRSGEQGEVRRDYFSVPLNDGQGKFISTYAGPNIRPTPSFAGEPLDIDLFSDNPHELAESLYSACAPQAGAEDVRVSVVVVFQNIQTLKKKIAIINAAD